jgi:hypothetical protein
LRVLLYFRSLGQEGECSTNDLIPPDVIFEQFEPQGIPRSVFDSELKRLARFGLLFPESQDPDRVEASTRFAVTKAGIYYLDSLYYNPAYFMQMVPDTLMTDNASAQTIAGFLRPYLTHAKVPLHARIDASHVFINYLKEWEEKETTLGAVAQHPLFGGHRFVPPMQQALLAVQNAAAQRK